MRLSLVAATAVSALFLSILSPVASLASEVTPTETATPSSTPITSAPATSAPVTTPTPAASATPNPTPTSADLIPANPMPVPSTTASASPNVKIMTQSNMTVTTPDASKTGARVNTAFTLPIVTTGAEGARTFIVSSGTLPTGFTLNSTTGVISGTTATRGDYPVIVQVKDTSGKTVQTGSFVIKVRTATDHTLIWQGTDGMYGAVIGTAVGTVVGSVTALDEVSGTTLAYSLETGSAAGYAVNASTGVITTTAAVTGTAGSVVTIKVGVTNGVNPKETQTFKIALISNAGLKLEKWEGCTTLVPCSGTATTTETGTQVHLPQAARPAHSSWRYTAYIKAPTSGWYTFYSNSDDNSKFFFAAGGPGSPSGTLPTTPTSYVSYWSSGYLKWDAPASQKSEPVYLVAGQLHAIEFDFHGAGGGGNDYHALAWQKPGESAPVNSSTAAIIPASAFVYPDPIKDSTAPTDPMNFVVGSTTTTQITLNWNPATDDTAVHHYELTRDGSVVSNALTASTGLNAYVDAAPAVLSGTHVYVLKAVDAAGNKSPGVTLSGVQAGRVWTPIEAAMTSGSASGITNPEDLMRAVNSEIDATKANVAGPFDAFYGGTQAIVYKPLYRSAIGNDALLAPNSSVSDRMFPLITADNVANKTLATVGRTGQNTPIAAFGIADPFNVNPTNNGNSLTEALTRLAKWMITGNATGATVGKKVVVVTRNGDSFSSWLQTSGIATASNITVCTKDTLNAACLAAIESADLVVLGTYVPTAANKATEVMSSVRKADAAHHPILYFDDNLYFYESAFGAAFDSEFGIDWGSSYWVDTNANVDPSSFASKRTNSVAYATYKLDDLKVTITHMLTNDWAVDLTKCAGRTCPSPQSGYVQNEFYYGAKDFLKANLDSMAKKGIRLFATGADQYRVYKAAVLLGDVLRRSIAYPVNRTDNSAFFRAYFADMSVYTVRNKGEGQTNLGTFSTTSQKSEPRITKSVTFTARSGDYMAAATVYAVPGETVTIRRTDSNATQSISVGFTTLREGSTHEFDATGYARPKYLQSAATPVAAGGSITLNSPYGGPMTVYLTGAGESETYPSVTLEFSGGVVQHPVWQSDADTAQFEALVKSGHFSWAEILSPGFQIHTRLDRLKDSVTLYRDFPTYAKMASAAYTDFYLKNYNEAGFVGPGLSRSSSVTALCSAMTLNCESKALHGIPSMNHFNADEPTCGFGCSGNPYDAAWGFVAWGWGDNHEMGHNIQSLHIANKSGVKQTGEVSNNIFPMHTMYSWNKNYPEKHHNVSHQFDQQALYATFLQAQSAADPQLAMHDKLWGAATDNVSATFVVNGTSTTRSYNINSAEVAFYTELVALAGSSYTPRSATTPFGDGGWELITLLHDFTRELSYQRGDDTRWAAWKDAHGFSSYTAAQARSLGLNDQMLLITSQVLKLDMTDYFKMWGVYFSDKAAAQVAGYAFDKAPKRFWYYEVEGRDNESQRPMFGITDPIGSVEIKAYDNVASLDIASTMPNVSQVILTTPDGNASTLRNTSNVLTVETAGLGTVAFSDNGSVITGCGAVDTAKLAFDENAYIQDFEAKCTWTPSGNGSHTLTATFTPSDPKIVAPTSPAQRVVTVSAPAAQAPTISSATGGATKSVGQSATLSVRATVTDGGVLTYQWKKDGTTIAGATSASYTIPTLASTNSGTYTCVVTNTVTGFTASTTSSPLTLSVIAAGVVPALSAATPTTSGFTFNVTNYDPNFTWTVTLDVSGDTIAVTKGTPTGTTLPVTVSGLSGGQQATATVTSTRTGYATNTATKSATALYPALTPVLSDATPTATGFTFSISNYDPAYTWTFTPSAGTVTQGTAVAGVLPVTVSSLAPLASATISVKTTRAGYANSAVITKTAAALGTARNATTSPVALTTSGYTFSITNYDANFTYTLTPSAGTLVKGTVSGATVPYTLSGVTSGQSATVSISVTRTGYASGSGSISGTALYPALTPVLSTATQTSDGFTFTVSNYDPAYVWTVTSTVGTATKGTVIEGVLPVTVKGLTALQTSTITVKATRAGYVDGTASRQSSALGAARNATVSAVANVTTSGYTFSITNFDANFTYTLTPSIGTATKGAASGATLPVMVTNVSPGTPATVSISVTRSGYASGTGSATATTLRLALTPTTSTPTQAADGSYTFKVTNFDAAYVWTITTTAGTVTQGAATGSTLPVTVKGLTATQSLNVTVKTSRAGYAGGTSTVVASAPLTPVLSAPVPTADGLTLNVTNYNATYNWTYAVSSAANSTPVVTAGQASGTTMPLTVTGLAPNTTVTVTVTAAKPGFVTGLKQATGKSLLAARTSTFGAVTSTATGFTVKVTNVDSTFTYTVTTSAGTVSKGTVTGTSPNAVLPLTVTGLTPGQEAMVSVKATKVGVADGVSTVSGAALGSPPVVN